MSNGKACALCGKPAGQDCHIKGKKDFKRDNSKANDRYRNIVWMCQYHHYHYLDAKPSRIFFVDSNHVIVLEIKGDKKYTLYKTKHTMNIRRDYMGIKNKECHPTLHRVYKKYKKGKLPLEPMEMSY